MAYQGALIHEFDEMARDYDFVTRDAREDADLTQARLRAAVSEYLESNTPRDKALRLS